MSSYHRSIGAKKILLRRVLTYAQQLSARFEIYLTAVSVFFLLFLSDAPSGTDLLTSQFVCSSFFYVLNCVAFFVVVCFV